MANQNLMKLVGIIQNLKIHIHGIPYIATFTVMWNNVLDDSCSMFIGQPWLRNAKVIHDWGENLITIKGNEVIQMISATKHLDPYTK
jgi:hypothetical protein